MLDVESMRIVDSEPVEGDNEQHNKSDDNMALLCYIR